MIQELLGQEEQKKRVVNNSTLKDTWRGMCRK